MKGKIRKEKRNYCGQMRIEAEKWQAKIRTAVQKSHWKSGNRDKNIKDVNCNMSYFFDTSF